MGSERKIPVEGHPLTGMSSDDRSETKSIEDTIPLGSNEVRNDYLIAVRKRTHAASIFELMIVVAIFIGVCIYYGMLYFSGVIVFSKPIFSFVFVSSGLTLFLEYALYILTNRTAAVLVVAFLFKTDLFMPSSEIPSGRRTYTSYTEEYFFTAVGRSAGHGLSFPKKAGSIAVRRHRHRRSWARVFYIHTSRRILGTRAEWGY